jgi:uncharacterized protein (TIGR02757 family)
MGFSLREIASGIDLARLEALYRAYNKSEYLRCDPVQFVHRYRDVRDREIAGLVASVLSYGRVAQICASVEDALGRMPRPSEFVRISFRRGLRRTFSGFRHRFTTGEDLAALLWGVKRAVERFGSLERCFTAGFHSDDDSVLPALAAFVKELSGSGFGGPLLPSPARGSACKRLNLYLRWMVRRDAIDPGGWMGVPASKLIVPLDTHMHRICRALRFTRRRQADIRAAVEVTSRFRLLAPADPVRYDFALTHAGIDGETARRCDDIQGS